jgi:hypothetical protein
MKKKSLRDRVLARLTLGGDWERAFNPEMDHSRAEAPPDKAAPSVALTPPFATDPRQAESFGPSSPTVPHPERLYCVEHLSFTQASDLLDWLERRNVDSREVKLDDQGLMTVRWVC